MSQSRIALAEVEALAARARLSATLEILQLRLDPRILARNAARDALDKSEKAARTGADAAIRNPGITAGIVTVLGLFLVRTKIIAAFRKPRPSISPGTSFPIDPNSL